MAGAGGEGSSQTSWMDHSLYIHMMTRPYVRAREVLSEEDIDGDAIFDELWKSVLREIYLVEGSSRSAPKLCSNATVREAIGEFEGQVQFLEGQAAADLTTPKTASKKRSFSEDDQEFVRDKPTSLQGDDRGISFGDEDSEFDFFDGAKHQRCFDGV